MSPKTAALLEGLRREHDLPALGALRINKAGALLETFQSGVRRADRPTPVGEQDCWHLGSNGKAMTAALCARMVDRGVVKWNTTLVDVYGAATIPAEWRDLQLIECLSMKGGVPEQDALNPTQRDHFNRAISSFSSPPAAIRHAVVTKALVSGPRLARPTGTAHIYSNLSTIVAGAMLEHLTSSDWESLMRQELFEPLRLQSAAFGAPCLPDSDAQPLGHVFEGGRARPLRTGELDDNPPYLGPAGTIHCSIQDYARWLVAILSRNTAFLSASSWQTLLDLHPDQQTYHNGWIRLKQPWSVGSALTHSGSNTLWYTTAWLSPGGGQAFVVFTNVAGPSTAEILNKGILFLLQN